KAPFLSASRSAHVRLTPSGRVTASPALGAVHLPVASCRARASRGIGVRPKTPTGGNTSALPGMAGGGVSGGEPSAAGTAVNGSSRATVQATLAVTGKTPRRDSSAARFLFAPVLFHSSGGPSTRFLPVLVAPLRFCYGRDNNRPRGGHAARRN